MKRWILPGSVAIAILIVTVVIWRMNQQIQADPAAANYMRTGSFHKEPEPEPEPTYKGKPLSHYVALLRDKDADTRYEAMLAIYEMPSFDATVQAAVAKRAWEEYERDGIRILAMQYTEHAIPSWTENKGKLLKAVAVCEQAGVDRLKITDDRYMRYALAYQRWKEMVAAKKGVPASPAGKSAAE